MLTVTGSWSARSLAVGLSYRTAVKDWPPTVTATGVPDSCGSAEVVGSVPGRACVGGGLAGVVPGAVRLLDGERSVDGEVLLDGAPASGAQADVLRTTSTAGIIHRRSVVVRRRRGRRVDMASTLGEHPGLGNTLSWGVPPVPGSRPGPLR